MPNIENRKDQISPGILSVALAKKPENLGFQHLPRIDGIFWGSGLHPQNRCIQRIPIIMLFFVHSAPLIFEIGTYLLMSL